MSENTARNVNPYVIPISIVIAGGVIALAIIFSSGGTTGNQVSAEGSTTGRNNFGNNNSPSAEGMRPVSSEDHVLGSRDAKVSIVEYSDFECPFCNRLHPTLTRIVDEFPGDVNWVYRHFPLTSIHSRAVGAAVAPDCAAQLGGNDALWEFSDQAFANQRSLGNSLYTEIAGNLGIDETAFSACVDSGRHQARVQADADNAIASGGRGTPFSIVVTEDGGVFPFSGALRYEQVRQIVEAALKS